MKGTLIVTTALAAITFVPQAAHSQPASLKEIARQNGGRASVSSDVNLPPISLSEMVRQSDVIFEARIVTKRGVLSSDESTVFTDYGLAPLKLLKDQAGAAKRKSPGATTPLIVRQPGGRITVDGLELAANNNLFPREGLDTNAVYIMFLRHDTADHVFRFVHGPYGVFKIEGTALVPPAGDAAAAKRSLPPERDSLYREIERLVKLPS